MCMHTVGRGYIVIVTLERDLIMVTSNMPIKPVAFYSIHVNIYDAAVFLSIVVLLLC